MPTEADTCRTYVLPKLYRADWKDDQIREQVSFTDGRILVAGQRAARKKQKRADYILRYRHDFPVAVVEAKVEYRHAADGLPQAKAYAEILGLKFAYATNGREIIEFDFMTGETAEIIEFPSPETLFGRLYSGTLDEQAKATLLASAPSNKPLRYYQDIAINRAVETILKGENRLLLTLATGTGKTKIAAQIAYRLWSSRWTRKGIGIRRPKILFVSDRNFLVDDPYVKDFAIFGDARHKIQREVNTSREMYFVIYQAISDREYENEWSPGLYHQYPPDFFDLIIVDECHRGSANEAGTWREILSYFRSAVQLGMTATPLRDDNHDSYAYFKNPLYIYSLQQGIDDGFLAPYRVHRIVSDKDLAGYRPDVGERDRYGRPIPDKVYRTPNFDKDLALTPRTQAFARHLTNFLKRTNRFAKTIVFCADQDHAAEMMVQLQKLNSDMMKEYPNYIVRITGNDGDEGRAYLDSFTDVEKNTPTIVTTSQLLSTGVDVPTCRVIAIARTVNSITEFKQIIGRGTRVRDDYGKLYFEIIDYTGSAVERFSDPEFDGYPALATEEEINEAGEVKPNSEKILQPEESLEGADILNEPPQKPLFTEDERYVPRKYYVDKGSVEIVANVVYELDPNGQRLRVVTYTEYTAEVVSSMFTTASNLRSKWSDADQRAAVIAALESRGVALDALLDLSGQPEADPFDMLCHVAFHSPLRTRRERSDYLRKEQREFFDKFGEEARQILNEILDKYVELGITQFKMPDVFYLPPLVKHGNVIEISKMFGGTENLRTALNEMQMMLYAAQ